MLNEICSRWNSALLTGALRDSSVSVVVTLGSISSHLLARSGSPSKPAIAGTIIDASWQGIPQKEGASGIRNLTYIDQSYPVGGTIADFTVSSPSGSSPSCWTGTSYGPSPR